MLKYKALVVADKVPAGTGIKKALHTQGSWNLLICASMWGEIPVVCTCAVCFLNCVCQYTLLWASLFNPDARVP